MLSIPLLAGLGAVRVMSTYHIFSQTTDEPAHLAAGMEWLERGTYTFEPLHPPLARVAIALGPFLSKLQLTGQGNLWQEGNEILNAHGRYLQNLTLARLGVLPFFILTTVLVWRLSRIQFGDGAALLATLLFTTSPVVLAHAGLATTDMPLTATFSGALLAEIYWLDRPTYPRCCVLGLACGLAILSKFSALLFLPACGLAVLACRWFLGRRKSKSQMPQTIEVHRWPLVVGLTTLTICLAIWAGYRFSVGSITTAEARPHATIDHFFGPRGTLHNWAYSVAESSRIPAPALFRGFSQIRQKNTYGHKAYLLGAIRQTGWWYFFPVALAVKTTLPFLFFIGIGLLYVAHDARRQGECGGLALAMAALALLLVCLPSRINIGIRHILPVYPLLAIIAGYGAARFWHLARPKWTGAIAVSILLAWHLASSFRVHPDYLGYFNELAGEHPERILIDSDLDWGQDLLRLSALLHRQRVKEISIAYAGSADLSRMGLPPFHELVPHQPTSGWIAISLLRLKTGGFDLPEDSFSWLEAHQPVSLVGRSIRLYNVPESTHQDTHRRTSKSQAKNEP